MSKSHLLINEQALQVLPSLALALGLEEAIAIQQLHYWLNNTKNEGRIDEDGNKWVYNTYAQWKDDNFPFWSEDKVQRIFLSLEKQGVVITRQLDAHKRDMKKFYSIDYAALCAMDDAILRPSNTAKVNDVKMNQRLPETTNNDGAKGSDQKPAFDMDKASVEWKIIAGEKIEQSDIDRNVLIQESQNSFESELHFMTLPWASTKDWEKFGKWVVSEYEKDSQVWRKYQTWRVGDGKYQGLMSNNKIAQKPLLFRDADFPTFLAHTQMNQKNTVEKKTDASGTPMSY